MHPYTSANLIRSSAPPSVDLCSALICYHQIEKQSSFAKWPKAKRKEERRRNAAVAAAKRDEEQREREAKEKERKEDKRRQREYAKQRRDEQKARAQAEAQQKAAAKEKAKRLRAKSDKVKIVYTSVMRGDPKARCSKFAKRRPGSLWLCAHRRPRT